MEFRKLSDRLDKLELKISEINDEIEELKSKNENMDDYLEWNYVKLKKFRKMKEKLNNLIFQLATSR